MIKFASGLSLLPSVVSCLAIVCGCSTSPKVDKPAQTEAIKTQWSPQEDSEAASYQAACIQIHNAAIEKFAQLEDPEHPATGLDFITEINELDILMDQALGKASLYRNVHPNSALRASADECQQKFVKLINRVTLSQALYQKLSSVEIESLDPLSAHYVQQMLNDLRRSGVNLDADTRSKIKKLNNEILLIGQNFNKNIREDIRQITIDSIAELKGLPQDYIDAHTPGEEGKIIISTNYPDYLPVMQYAENDNLRLRLYKEFRKRGYPANESVLRELLAKRFELAQLLGYRDYAEYVMEDLMIGNPENAQNFIDKVNRLAQPRSDQDYQVLLERLQKIQPKATTVGDWQKTYIKELVKNERYHIDSQSIRQYFRYSDVRRGIFDLTETLFGVTIENWQGESWHHSVESYKVMEGDKLIGYFYLDMHPRAGKYNHAAAFTIRDGVKDKQAPISALVCNFPGGGNDPGYMEHSQVETFLHEFGHLLHALFGGHQRWMYFSGIKTERDFVEAPSQMLEEWVWDAATLKTFAKNEQGEALPDELINKMKAGRNFGRGLWTRHQLFYAALSLNLYLQDTKTVNFVETVKTLQSKYSPYNYVEDTYFHNSFGHLYGYSSIYYTYMWSLVIASDMFEKFSESGLRNQEVAKLYREKVLQPGGSKPAAELVKGFLGRPYSFESFTRQLNQSNQVPLH